MLWHCFYNTYINILAQSPLIELQLHFTYLYPICKIKFNTYNIKLFQSIKTFEFIRNAIKFVLLTTFDVFSIFAYLQFGIIVSFRIDVR